MCDKKDPGAREIRDKQGRLCKRKDWEKMRARRDQGVKRTAEFFRQLYSSSKVSRRGVRLVGLPKVGTSLHLSP